MELEIAAEAADAEARNVVTDKRRGGVKLAFLLYSEFGLGDEMWPPYPCKCLL